MFKIYFNSSNSSYVDIGFYNPSDIINCKYFVLLDSSEAYLFDYTISEYLYVYNINSDGSLGSLILD